MIGPNSALRFLVSPGCVIMVIMVTVRICKLEELCSGLG